MTKKFRLFKQSTMLSREEFEQRWIDRGRSLTDRRGFRNISSRYVQNHLCAPAEYPSAELSGAGPAFDGVEVTWLEPQPSEEFALDPALDASLLPIDRDLMNLDGACSVFAEEIPMCPDASDRGIKMMAFMRRNPKLTHEEFCSYWRNEHAQLAQSLPEFWRHFGKYMQNHCIPGTHIDANGDRVMPEYDGVLEAWFEDVETMKKAFAEPRYMSVIRPDELKFLNLPSHRLFVREREFFPSDRYSRLPGNGG